MKLATYANISDAANGDAVRVSTTCTRSSRAAICRSSPVNAGRSNTSRRHSRYVSRIIGNDPYREATFNKSAERWRWAHSGERLPGNRRGSSSARAAFSRNRAANTAVPPRHATTRSSISSAGINKMSTSGGPSAAGKRSTMPSSDHIVSTSAPMSSLIRAAIAIAHGACTRAPNGDSRHTR